jgi:hypothetical protein
MPRVKLACPVSVRPRFPIRGVDILKGDESDSPWRSDAIFLHGRTALYAGRRRADEGRAKGVVFAGLSYMLPIEARDHKILLVDARKEPTGGWSRSARQRVRMGAAWAQDRRSGATKFWHGACGSKRRVHVEGGHEMKGNAVADHANNPLRRCDFFHQTVFVCVGTGGIGRCDRLLR